MVIACQLLAIRYVILCSLRPRESQSRATAEATGRPYQELRGLMTGNSPMARMVYPEELAAAVFLASNEADGLTG